MEKELPTQENLVADSNETAKIAPKEAMPAENAPVDMNKNAEEKPAEQKAEEPKEDNATISSLQKEILDGKDISELEETAAGGNIAGGGNGGEGVSLGAASFVQSGHESSIYADYNGLNEPFAFSFSEPVSSVGGAAGEAVSDSFISGERPVVQPSIPNQPSQPISPAQPTTPGSITTARSSISVTGGRNHDGEIVEGSNYKYLDFIYRIENAPVGSQTTNLKVDIDGTATIGKDYERPEYSLDNGNTWTQIDPDMIIKNVEVKNGIIKVRVGIIDDNGLKDSSLEIQNGYDVGMLDGSIGINQNEGERISRSEFGPNVAEYGTYAESINIKISSDNNLIETSSSSGKIIDNDDYAKIIGDVDGSDHTLYMGDGEDKIYDKDGAINNIKIDMGSGNDVFMKEYSTIDDDIIKDVATDKNGDPLRASLRDTIIDMGEGDDAAIIAAIDFEHSAGKESKIDLGSGDDLFIIASSRITDAKILGGDGNDNIDVSDNKIIDTIVDGGAGNDEIRVLNMSYRIGEPQSGMHNSKILGGDGDDIIFFSAEDTTSEHIFDVSGNTFDGGDGLDTLVVGNFTTLMDNTNTYKNFEILDVSALGEHDAIEVTNKSQLADLVDRFTNNGSHELTLVTSKDEGGFYHGNMYFHSEGGNATLGISPLPQGVTINPVDDKFYQINFEHNGADYTLKVQNEIMYSVATYDYL